MKLLLPFFVLLSAAAPLCAQISLPARFGATRVDLAREALPALQWDSLQPGLELTEFVLDAGRLGLDVRVIVARLDPAQFDFALIAKTRANRMTGAWSVQDAPLSAALAINAGQFKETGPWGWLVLDGYEKRDPGFGPLSVGIVFDSTGVVRWLPFRSLTQATRNRGVRYAFQSYPALRLDHAVPALATGADVDQSHRDARLILAQDSVGRLLFVLTRYDALGGTVARIPIGLTVPESIVLIGALGARHAVMLDGGVSAQMLLRAADGRVHSWKGMREVPLALVAFPRIQP